MKALKFCANLNFALKSYLADFFLLNFVNMRRQENMEKNNFGYTWKHIGTIGKVKENEGYNTSWFEGVDDSGDSGVIFMLH